MRGYIKLIKEIIDKELVYDSRYKLIKFTNFVDPKIYLEIANHYYNKFFNTDIVFVAKLSREKYSIWRTNQNYKKNLDDLESKNFIELDGNLTKWRNYAFMNPDKKFIIFLFGTEVVEDRGGLEEFFTISTETIENYISNDYSLLLQDCFLSIDEKEYINKIFTIIFSYVGKDLYKLSNFFDRSNTNGDILALINAVFNNLYNTWSLPNIFEPLSHTDNWPSLIHQGYQFSRRINLEKFQSNKKIETIKKGIDDYYNKNKEILLENWDHIFPRYSSIDEFKKDLIDYINCINIDVVKDKLLQCDFLAIKYVLNYKETKTEPSKISPKVYGDPFKALFLPILELYKDLESKGVNNVHSINIKIKKIKLANVREEGNDLLIDKWEKMCYFLGGIEKLLDNSIVNTNGDIIKISIYSDNDSNDDIINPFNPVNTKMMVKLNILEKASAREAKSKITFDYEFIENIIHKYENYEWSIYDYDEWVGFSNFIFNEQLLQLIRSKDPLIPIAYQTEVDSLLNANSIEEFSAVTNKINLHYENILEKANGNIYGISNYYNLGRKYVDYLYVLIHNGFFETMKSYFELTNLLTEFERFVDDLTNQIKNKTIKDNEINMLLKAFLILNDDEVCSNGIKGAIISPLHPIMLEKIVDRYTYLANGFIEIINQVFNKEEKDVNKTFSRFIQLSTINSAADVLINKNNDFISSKVTYGFYSLYGEVNEGILELNTEMDFDDDFEDIDLTLEETPVSRYFTDVIIKHLKTYPSKIDGLSINFFYMNQINDLIKSISNLVNIFKKKKEKLYLKVNIYTDDYRCKINNIIKFWIEKNISEDNDIYIDIYVKYLNLYNDSIKIEQVIEKSDVSFIQDIMTDKLIEPEEYEFLNGYDENEKNRFPSVYLPMFTDDESTRAINLTQKQFRCEFKFTQLVIFVKNKIAKDNKFIIKKIVSLDKKNEELLTILHEKSFWVVVLDKFIDANILDYHNNKIISFSTGEGYFGELNSTISTSEIYLDDLKSFLKNRLKRKLIRFTYDEIKQATDNLISYSKKLDGGRLLQAINPDSDEINNYLAYVLTSLIESNYKDDDIIIRKIVSLDSYSHLFNDNYGISYEENMRPDFLVLEVYKNLVGNKVHINAKIVECKFCNDFRNHINKAIEQVNSGIRVLSEIWNPENKSVQRRYWMNQLYRILVMNTQFSNLNTNEINRITNMLSYINDNMFEIKFKKVVYTFSLENSYDTKFKKYQFYDEQDGITHYDFGFEAIKDMLINQDIEKLKLYDELSFEFLKEIKENSDLITKDLFSDSTINININDNIIDIKNEKIYEVHESKQEYVNNDYQGPKDVPISINNYLINEDILSTLHSNNNFDNIKLEEDYAKECINIIINRFQIRKIDIKIRDYIIGTDIIRFNMIPGPRTNYSHIDKHLRDIQVWLGANAQPIIFVEDGFIKLDVVRNKRQTVTLREVLTKLNMYYVNGAYKNIKQHLYGVLGVDVLGNPFMIDFSDSNSPHLLIAGQTGSGKSVLLTSLLTSIMCMYDVDDIEMYLIDPKKVELVAFKNSPFTKEVITDTESTVKVLKDLVIEMEKRYSIFENLLVKDISSYNKHTEEQKMKRILVVIDEYASLVNQDKVLTNQLETLISELGAKARAAGIHLIVCTQTPKAEILTTKIRNNLTCRIALRVTDNTASQLILDNSGAENLLGKGDMLFKGANTFNLLRLKSPYVSEDEVHNLMNILSKTKGVKYEL